MAIGTTARETSAPQTGTRRDGGEQTPGQAGTTGQAWTGYLKSLQGTDAELKLPHGTTPVQRLNGAPPNVAPADVVELTDAGALPGELRKTGAHYAHLKAQGQDVWLYLGDTPDPGVLSDLTAGLLAPDGSVRGDVQLDKFYTLDGNAIVVGEAYAQETPIEANTRASGHVLGRSNDETNVRGEDDELGRKMDEVWKYANGGRGELDAAQLPADRRTGPDQKEGAWYNGIRLDDDQNVQIERSPQDERTDELPQMTLQEFRDMLVRDFDYEGAITAFRNAGGEAAFVEAVIRRFPDREKALRVIAREVWSYATTGMDTKGTTNIAQMQGYLYALDPNIKVSSDTNTDLGRMFNAGTKEEPVLVQAGDGAHGRASILTTRHIVSSVAFADFEPGRVPLQNPQPQFSDRDRFVHDNSRSMTDHKLPTIVDGVDQQLGRGAYDPTGTKPSMDTQVDGTFGDRDEHRLDVLNAAPDPNLRKVGSRDPRSEVLDYSKVIEDAYVKIYPNRTKADADAFAQLFGVNAGAVFQKKRENGQAVYVLDGDALRKEIGDVNPQDANQDAGGESSLKAIIATLLYNPQYADAALANLKPAERPRLNAVADESEQGLEYLELAKKLAQRIGVEVRIVAVPTDEAGFNPATDVAIIDLQTMRLAPANANGAPDEVGRLQFEAVINGAKRSMDVPVTKDLADVIETQAGHLKPLQKAGAPLTAGQTVAGRRNE
jgi:hypothetical protein